MYDRVLVPLDRSARSEQVMPYARVIARALGIPLHLLSVVPRPDRELALAAVEGDLVDLKDQKLAAELAQMQEAEIGVAAEALEQVAKGLREQGYLTRVTVAVGDPAEVIAGEADQTPGTLIAMATHGRSGPGRWLLGSVTDKVVHHANHPTLVVRATKPGKVQPEPEIHEVIAALDGSELAEVVLPHAVQLAKTFDAKLVLLHAVRLDLSEAESAGTVTAYSRMREAAMAMAKAYLSRVETRLRHSGVREIEERAVPGTPEAAILEAQGTERDRVVVMCTHGRSGIRRLLLGSVTDRVVTHSTGPVLVARAGMGA